MGRGVRGVTVTGGIETTAGATTETLTRAVRIRSLDIGTIREMRSEDATAIEVVSGMTVIVTEETDTAAHQIQMTTGLDQNALRYHIALDLRAMIESRLASNSLSLLFIACLPCDVFSIRYPGIQNIDSRSL